MKIGLPKLMPDDGDYRVFPVKFIHFLEQYGSVHIASDYDIQYVSGIRVVATDDLLFRDIDFSLSIRRPSLKRVSNMHSSAYLMTCFHPEEDGGVYMGGVERFGIKPIAIDHMKTCVGDRLVHGFEIGARNAVREVVKTTSNKEPRVLILGTGVMSHLCMREFFKQFDNPSVTIAGRSFFLKNNFSSFKDVDVLVDTIDRISPWRKTHLVPNSALALLPEDAVILDISVDVYGDGFAKTIEGIPNGNPKKFFFDVDDVAYNSLPSVVSCKERRKVISCISYPALTPKESMEIISERLMEVLPSVFEKVLYNKQIDKSIGDSFL